MAHALALGRRGAGQVWPNPAVGCVIVQGGRVVGRGWTQAGGRPHAEAVALAQAGPLARGATAFVTLEPCAHVSLRGPDCTGLLIGAAVARVVTALTDPDPRTAGQGHARLRAAGVSVTEGVGAAAARADLAGFLARVAGRPVPVTLKLAVTLDGRIATRTGASRWITGPVARRAVHALRARHDAVMVGIGTALADDPDLTVRDLGLARQPVRVVLDRRLRLPRDSRLGQGVGRAPLWLVHAAGADAAPWAGTGVRLIAAPEAAEGLDLRAALVVLGQAGLTSILSEGGARMAAALLRAGLVGRLVIHQAGRVIGGDGLAAVAALGLDAVPERDWRLVDVRPLGDDLCATWERGEG
jgi:diaminohydroxyphosphoribosylaminopyrimidine deaminase/5-amino-6-(5-phosphoribosylamino)uracil reductase